MLQVDGVETSAVGRNRRVNCTLSELDRVDYRVCARVDDRHLIKVGWARQVKAGSVRRDRQVIKEDARQQGSGDCVRGRIDYVEEFARFFDEAARTIRGENYSEWGEADRDRRQDGIRCRVDNCDCRK